MQGGGGGGNNLQDTELAEAGCLRPPVLYQLFLNPTLLWSPERGWSEVPAPAPGPQFHPPLLMHLRSGGWGLH